MSAIKDDIRALCNKLSFTPEKVPADEALDVLHRARTEIEKNEWKAVDALEAADKRIEQLEVDCIALTNDEMREKWEAELIELHQKLKAHVEMYVTDDDWRNGKPWDERMVLRRKHKKAINDLGQGIKYRERKLRELIGVVK